MKEERRKQLISLAKNDAGVGPWSDKLRARMTAGEIRHVSDYWKTLKGNASFLDAFMGIPENWEPCDGCAWKEGDICTHMLAISYTENGIVPGRASGKCNFYRLYF